MEEIMTTDTESIYLIFKLSVEFIDPRWFRVSWTHPLFSVSNIRNLLSGWTSWSSLCNVYLLVKLTCDKKFAGSTLTWAGSW